MSFLVRDSKYLSRLKFLVEVSDFEVLFLCGYLYPDGVPHRSSDVVFLGESISDRFTGVRALYLLISGALIIFFFFRKCLAELDIAYQLEIVAHM